jgi:hypothetical protein
MRKELLVPEDTVRGCKDPTVESEKRRSIAYSMKLVNGVYNKLIEVFEKQIKEETDEYVMGWNDAFKAVVAMTEACKYTKEDYIKMTQKEDDADDKTAGG